MGYYVKVEEGQILIDSEREDETFASVKAAIAKVEGSEPEQEDLGELLSYYGFEVENFDPDELAIVGFDEKDFSALEPIGRALAVGATEGSYLEWRGDDGERWRWWYTGIGFEAQVPETTWRTVEAILASALG